MGFVEILYKDQSGLHIADGEIKEMAWDWCGTCRTITNSLDGKSTEFGVFICSSCLGSPNEPA